MTVGLRTMKARTSALTRTNALKQGQVHVKGMLSAKTLREASIAPALRDTLSGPLAENVGI